MIFECSVCKVKIIFADAHKLIELSLIKYLGWLKKNDLWFCKAHAKSKIMG